jgi:pimeloyl-ACP methyl ester carboxylesterase
MSENIQGGRKNENVVDRASQDELLTAVAHSAELRCQANGIELAYDWFGAEDAPPLVLVQGLGCQMIAWDDAFCARLAAAGYRVIRFDNRDIGKSTLLPHLGVPNIAEMFAAIAQGAKVAAPYLLRDMAADLAGLLDALSIEQAHVVGASMGGAIAQTLAIGWPRRVRTLSSIMSNTGEAGFPPPTPEALSLLLTPPPLEREGYIADYANRWKVLRGAGFTQDEAMDPVRAGRIFDRGLNPAGVARQLAAIIASPGRARALADLRVPALVMHGDADPLVHFSGGSATAAAIPGARLQLLQGMGHAIPVPYWSDVIGALARHCI